jgi:DNA-binding CsgD family transcriptional regulator
MHIMADGREILTERELEVVRLVATGATNQQIARELVISVNTVKVHLKNIFAKLDIQSRTEVALHAVSQGWVELDRPVSAPEEAVSDVEPPTTEPISLRKRVFFVVAALITALLVFFPLVESESYSPVSSEFVDRSASTNLTGPALQLYRWNSMAPLPAARSRFAAAYDGGRIYAIGGDTVDGVSGVVEEYDTSTNSWRARSSKPIPVNNIGAEAIGGRVYVPGGYTEAGEVIAELEIYDRATDSWERGASLSLPLCAYAIVAVDEKLYVFGGWDGSTYLASTYEYDASTDIWSQKTSMPSARGFAGAGVIEGKIYVIGGYDGREEFATVEEYDPAMDDGTHDPWTVKSPMMMRRGGLGVAAIAGTLYAIGGGWHGYLAHNERYDATTDQWSVTETPVFGQWRNLGVVASDTKIYAIGGWNGDYLSLNEEYQALFTYYLPELPR